MRKRAIHAATVLAYHSRRLWPRSTVGRGAVTVVIFLSAMSAMGAIALDPVQPWHAQLASVERFPEEILQVPGTDGGMAVPTGIGSGDILAGNAATDHPVTPAGFRWREVVVEKGDTLAGILRAHGIDDAALEMAVRWSREAFPLRRLKPGQRFSLGIDTEGRLADLVLHDTDSEPLRLRRNSDGSYRIERLADHYETRLAYAGGHIEDSLFGAGYAAGLSDAVIMQLAAVFGWDIDFALDVHRGDRFSVTWEEKYWRGEKIGDGNLLAAEFVNQGRTYRAIGFPDASGAMRYYTPAGNSVERQFLRTPVQFSRISSRYSSGRYHPILKQRRAHRGVDYAAPVGTPVRATATGRISTRGRLGGYGNTVIVRHGGKYSTLYAHLSGFRRGQREGGLVRQGEIIGYIGKTGLATGPHLHYEFRIYDAHRNPLTIALPKADGIADLARDAFASTATRWTGVLDRLGGRTHVAAAQ